MRSWRISNSLTHNVLAVRTFEIGVGTQSASRTIGQVEDANLLVSRTGEKHTRRIPRSFGNGDSRGTEDGGVQPRDSSVGAHNNGHGST